jgi:hypothetical protein
MINEAIITLETGASPSSLEAHSGYPIVRDNKTISQNAALSIISLKFLENNIF